MDESISTDQNESAAESKPKSSAESGPSSKPQETKTPKPSAGAKPKAAPKKTALTKKSTGSLAQSKNLPPSALLGKASTSTSGNGGGSAYDGVRISTMGRLVEYRMLTIFATYEDGRLNSQMRAEFGAQLQRMREQLGAGDDALEVLLIERIVLTWARLQWCELQAAHTLDGASSVAMAEYWDKSLDQAHSRFLKSCLALERVRKLRRRSSTMDPAAAAYLKQYMTSDWTAADGLRNSR